MTVKRSRSINVQQFVSILTGMFYAFIGAAFLVSPVFLMRLLNVNANPDWAAQIRYDDFLVYLHLIARLLSGLLFLTGLSMILPLYDPIRYRELIYFNGVFFPVFAILFFAKKSFDYKMKEILVLGLFFFAVAVINFTGLMITRNLKNR